MDPLNALKNDVFRPLAAVVMPGILALSPFVILLCNAMDDVANFYKAQPTWFFLLVAGTGTVVGMLLENLGSSIERGIDQCMEVEYLEGHNEVWEKYLGCQTTDQNGRRFLGVTVTRLMFINSLMPALVLFSIGILALHWQVHLWSQKTIYVFLAVVFFTLVWLFRTATELSEVASTTRYNMLDPAQRPACYESAAVTVGRHRHFAYVIGELLTSRVFAIDLLGRWWIAVFPASFALAFPKATSYLKEGWARIVASRMG